MDAKQTVSKMQPNLAVAVVTVPVVSFRCIGSCVWPGGYRNRIRTMLSPRIIGLDEYHRAIGIP